MACHPARAAASARTAARCWRLPGSQGVAQADGDVGDVGFELGRDGWRAEPAVQQADGVGFLLEDLDDRGVDVAGAGDLPQQLALLLPALGGRRLVARRCG